ncbi:hypothetical protein POVWA2_036720 [Plasmodium ovale wallikeri]|uniref:Uncharacterized protein n=1 Tax=Plasmodium ovale wallikeri TaxID=864142 RepID=A0A1A8Z529_PLAOA|nr:hypothetical protein POVWA2_036720 [Plasmodium ovale wallikeri]
MCMCVLNVPHSSTRSSKDHPERGNFKTSKQEFFCMDIRYKMVWLQDKCDSRFTQIGKCKQLFKMQTTILFPLFVTVRMWMHFYVPAGYTTLHTIGPHF